MHNFSFLINKTASALPLFDIDNQAEVWYTENLNNGLLLSNGSLSAGK